MQSKKIFRNFRVFFLTCVFLWQLPLPLYVLYDSLILKSEQEKDLYKKNMWVVPWSHPTASSEWSRCIPRSSMAYNPPSKLRVSPGASFQLNRQTSWETQITWWKTSAAFFRNRGAGDVWGWAVKRNHYFSRWSSQTLQRDGNLIGCLIFFFFSTTICSSLV